ncbi:MAG: 3-isopropylmalate dehydrogenase [Thalassobaculaceae bacterium]
MSSANAHTVVVLPGDGIGLEVTAQARRVLEWASDQDGMALNLADRHYGNEAYKRSGEVLTDETLADVLAADAVLFGASGTNDNDDIPREVRKRGSLLRMRKEMDVFANLRPVRMPEALLDASPLVPERARGTDMIFVRELTSGLYFGQPKMIEDLPDGSQRGVDTQAYTTGEISRVADFAFELARSRSGKLHSVEKSNVMESGRLWRQVVTARHADHSDIELIHMLGDNCGMQLVKNPGQFDVILADNMFGDILSDVAGGVMGTLGMLPSASLSAPGPDGRRKAFFEPVHGSAPDIAGQGVANPLAAIQSAGMMLRLALDAPALADRVDRAIDTVLAAGVRTADIARPGTTPVTTAGMGDAILAALVDG